MLPLIGFAIILKATVKKNYEFIYFVLGFVLLTVFKVNIISVFVVALVLALSNFRYGKVEGEQ